MIYDHTICTLGEGPLWHPMRQKLIWFDIMEMRMYERGEDDTKARMWQFDEYVSAAGWIDEFNILIASETSLFHFDLKTSKKTHVIDLEADNTQTRSNDGRADPFGGFWIGTMGKNKELGAGAIYRFYQGRLKKLFEGITISNSICFDLNRKVAYFCDTPTQKIMSVSFDEEGWPNSGPFCFADVKPHYPDGSVVDMNGNLHNAQWGSNRIAVYNPQGDEIGAYAFQASQVSCPAFGGRKLDKLFTTTAAEGLSESSVKHNGFVFVTSAKTLGVSEYSVKVDIET